MFVNPRYKALFNFGLMFFITVCYVICRNRSLSWGWGVHQVTDIASSSFDIKSEAVGDIPGAPMSRDFCR